MTSAEKGRRGQEMQQICGQRVYILQTKAGVKQSPNYVDVIDGSP